MKILVISMAGIGDTILATPFIHELRLSYPDARIDALVLWAGSRDILEGNPHLNHIHQRNLLKQSKLEALRFIWSLRRIGYDLSINTHPESRLHYRLIARIVGARTRISHTYESFGPLDPFLVNRTLPQDYRKREDLLLLARLVRNRKGLHSEVAAWAAHHGYMEIRADGRIYDTRKPFRLDRFREHDVEIVVVVLEARVRAGRSSPTPRHLVEETLKLGRGTLFALDNAGALSVHSTERACPKCGRSFAPLDPKNFSYNSPAGWCPLAAVSANCSGCRKTWIAARGPMPSKNRGSTGWKANASNVQSVWGPD